MIYISYGNGPEKGFLVSGDLSQQLAKYMNFKNPKHGYEMIWPKGEHKGKTVKYNEKKSKWIIQWTIKCSIC